MYKLSSFLILLIASVGAAQRPILTSQLQIDTNQDATAVTLNETELTVVKNYATSATIPLADGSSSAPSLHFADDTNTGIYSSQDGRINLVSDGTVTVYFDDSEIDFSEPLSMDGTVWLTEALELSNIATLDSTTEATIEAALDTLANVTSIGGESFSLGGTFSTGDTFSTTGTFSSGGAFSTSSTFTASTAISMDQDVGTNDSVAFAGLTVDTSAWVVPNSSGDITTDRDIDSSGAGDFGSFELAGSEIVDSSGNATFVDVDATGDIAGTGDSITLTNNQDAVTAISVINTSTGTSARSRYNLQNNAGSIVAFQLLPTTHSTYHGDLLVEYPSSEKFVVLSASTLRFQIDGSGNLLATGYIEWGSGGPRDFKGSGTPEGSITANVGSTYRRTDGGASTSFYVKESGTGNTGWVAK